MTHTPSAAKTPGVFHPFRRAMFRGLAVVLPPLLTVLVFLWAWGMLETYILAPVESAAAKVIVWSIRDIKPGAPDGAEVYRAADNGPVTSFKFRGKQYVHVGNNGRWIPEDIKLTVEANRSD